MTAATRPHTKCRTSGSTAGGGCGQRYDAHIGEQLLCPNGSGNTFSKRAERICASQSFSPAEVEFILRMWSLIRRGGDVAVLARNERFVQIGAKFQRMDQSIKRQRGE